VLTTGVFTTHRFEIKIKKYGEPIYLIPFGDIHRDSPLCAVDRWMEFLDWARSKKNAYFLGMGDYHDFSSTSERTILSNDALHESTQRTIENVHAWNTAKFAKEIEFMRGKIVGLLEGNHYGVFPNGTTTTQRLADLLGTCYLGVLSYFRLTLKGHGTTTNSVDVYAHHGRGAARLIGGSLNKVQQMGESAEADILLMGHDHKKSAAIYPRMRLSENSHGKLEVKQRKIIVARTGSFLKGLVDGEASYIADMAGSPTDLGVVKIEMTPKREQKNYKDKTWIDLHISI